LSDAQPNRPFRPRRVTLPLLSVVVTEAAGFAFIAYLIARVA